MLPGMHAARLYLDYCCCFPVRFHSVLWMPAALIHVAHWLHGVVIVIFAFWHSGSYASVCNHYFALTLMQSVRWHAVLPPWPI